MKNLNLFLVSGLFIAALTSCNENPKDDDPTSTITPGNYSNSDTSSHKKSAVSIDTLSNAGVEGGAVKNNPDITK